MGSLEQLLPVINKLQDVFSTVATSQQPISLPQLAVVGAQSAGKSSVLETLVGKDFLPRGNDIVTRCPLILQLVNTKTFSMKDSGDGAEWGTFLHTGDKKWPDFMKIRDEIQRRTEEVAPGANVTDKPIRLTIYSPNVLNLTIVDLPGMTKVPVKNQPQNISELIRRLLLKYITQKNCIILAVSPANADLANSDALQLARSVDARGLRTLGVITKIDLMDAGTNALDYLNGKVVPLKLGYVGVKNRSQQDIMDGMTIAEAIKKEQTFFGTHNVYRSISHRCGSKYLGIQMSRILVNHIKDTLPSLRAQISKHVNDIEEELANYGAPLVMGDQNQSAMLLSLITQYATNFNNAIDGKVDEGKNLNNTELYGGARILYIFRVIFSREIGRLHAYDGLTDEAIRTSIRNASGARQCLFVPEISFELLVKNQIEKLRRPALSCMELVFQELQRCAGQSETPSIQRFDKLQSRLADEVNRILRKLLDPTRLFINNLIDVELAYVNTNHPDFVSGSRAVQHSLQAGNSGPKAAPQNVAKAKPAAPDNPKSGGWSLFGGGNKDQADSGQPPAVAPSNKNNSSSNNRSGGGGGGYSRSGGIGMHPSTDREEIEINLIKILIKSYFEIVKKSILDTVPKATMFHLVNLAKKSLQADLVYALYNTSNFEDLLKESPEVTRKRKTCLDLLKVLKRAQEILNEVRDFKVIGGE